MAPSTRDRERFEDMAISMMIDGMSMGGAKGHRFPFSLCTCGQCATEAKGKADSCSDGKRKAPNGDSAKPGTKNNKSGHTCDHNHHNHHHHHQSPNPRDSSPLGETRATSASQKPQSPTSSQSKSKSPPKATMAAASPREEKISSLMKAKTMDEILEVFNTTPMTEGEKDLVGRIQHAAKDCKLYTEAKEQIVAICETDSMQRKDIAGLIAKFRQERSLLTSAMLKSNADRDAMKRDVDKIQLHIQRVDDLMYMLQDMPNPKNSSSDQVLSKLHDIILETHDLARCSSSELYDELLDLREDHTHLLDDYEALKKELRHNDDHHDELHAKYDKLSQTHAKLLAEHSELRKKASSVGHLKADVSRLEKVVDRNNDENTDLKKEIERLTGELTKFKALKHENAQLKKSVAALKDSQPAAGERVPTPGPAPASASVEVVKTAPGKKKKGKKGQKDLPVQFGQITAPAETESTAEDETQPSVSSGDEATVRLKAANEFLENKLEAIKEHLNQLELLREKAEKARDQALQSYHMEQGKSQNWQDLAERNEAKAAEVEIEKGKTQAELKDARSVVTRLHMNIEKLQNDLSRTEKELRDAHEAHTQVSSELKQRSSTPAALQSSQLPPPINPATIRLLRKIKTEMNQLVRDVEQTPNFGDDPFHLLNAFRIHTRRSVLEIERIIEEILEVGVTHGSPFGIDNSLAASSGSSGARYPHSQTYSQTTQSPQASPHLSFTPSASSAASGLPPYRPMMPPGFSEPLSAPQSFPRQPETSTLPSRFITTPSSTSSILQTPSSAQPLNLPQVPPGLGPIGTRSVSASTGVSVVKPSSSPVGGTTPSSVGPGAASLGNGAAGVDWSMWSKAGK